jgi:hypothetical protein
MSIMWPRCGLFASRVVARRDGVVVGAGPASDRLVSCLVRCRHYAITGWAEPGVFLLGPRNQSAQQRARCDLEGREQQRIVAEHLRDPAAGASGIVAAAPDRRIVLSGTIPTGDSALREANTRITPISSTTPPTIMEAAQSGTSRASA